jgi:hypothetical protein
MGFLDGTAKAPPETIPAIDPKEPKTPNPAYDLWLARDQVVLSHLTNSMSPNILLHVHTHEHAFEVWAALAEMFASQARSRTTNLRIALGNTKKLEMTTDAYFNKMKKFADELATAIKPLEDAQMVSYLVAGLDHVYNSAVAAINALPKSLKLMAAHVYQQIVDYDERQ